MPVPSMQSLCIVSKGIGAKNNRIFQKYLLFPWCCAVGLYSVHIGMKPDGGTRPTKSNNLFSLPLSLLPLLLLSLSIFSFSLSFPRFVSEEEKCMRTLPLLPTSCLTLWSVKSLTRRNNHSSFSKTKEKHKLTLVCVCAFVNHRCRLHTQLFQFLANAVYSIQPRVSNTNSFSLDRRL